MKNLTAAAMHRDAINQAAESDNGPQSLFVYQKNLFKGEDIIQHNSSSHSSGQKRKSTRLQVKGIVALTSFAKPVVTNIYDIAPDGVSFLHANAWDICSNQFKMDILIFDNHSDSEYFISHVTGRVTSRKLVTDLKSNKPVWLFGVEFIDFDSAKQEMLQTFCSRAQKPTDRLLGEYIPSRSYDS
ncbi:hypothetical protein [Desulfocastanea catecholica]